MPARRGANDNEPPVMTWGKAAPALAVIALFDIARVFFVFFWFFGPALTGTVAASWLANWLPNETADAVGAAVAGGSGFFLAGAFGAFGAIMAMVVGMAGGFALGAILLLANHRIFKANEKVFLWMLLGFGITQVPFINGLPSLSVTAWRLYHTQIKAERAAHKAWREARDARDQEERAALDAEIAARRARLGGRHLSRAAPDNDEIPEEERLAA